MIVLNESDPGTNTWDTNLLFYFEAEHPKSPQTSLDKEASHEFSNLKTSTKAPYFNISYLSDKAHAKEPMCSCKEPPPTMSPYMLQVLIMSPHQHHYRMPTAFASAKAQYARQAP